MRPAVFLDRDNTLIANDGDLGSPDAVRLVDGVPGGLKLLRDAGFSLVVVTNQAGVARGRFSERDVDEVHQRIATLVDDQAKSEGLIERFYYCPYHPEATVAQYKRDHPWRKPHPGMILQAARDMTLDLSHSWLIGDQERDIAAGRAAGCRTILVAKDAALAQRAQPTELVPSFTKAVEHILRHSGFAANGAARKPLKHEPSAAPASPPPPRPADAQPSAGDLSGTRRAILELIDELRSDRLRRSEFTPLRMVAGISQLLVILLALLGLMQMGDTAIFMKWMAGAALMQLITLTLLVLDLKS